MSLIDDILKKGNVKEITEPDQILTVLDRRSKNLGSCGPSYRMTPEGDNVMVELDAQDGIVRGTATRFPSLDQLKKLVAERGMPWHDEYATRFEHFWTSDERVDGAGDIVRQNWDFSRYERLSRVLHAHNWGGLPIGRSVLWEVRDRKVGKDYNGPALYQVFLFATAEQNPEAGIVQSLVAARFMTETSVGFFPQKILHVDNDDDRKELGLGRWGVVFERNQLVETSTCAVACNEGAQVAASFTKMKEGGTLEPGHLDTIRGLIAHDTTKNQDQRNTIDGIVCDVFKDLFPDNTPPAPQPKDEPEPEERDADDEIVTALEEFGDTLTKQNELLLRIGTEVRELLVDVLSGFRRDLEALRNGEELLDDDDEYYDDDEQDDADLDDEDEEDLDDIDFDEDDPELDDDDPDAKSDGGSDDSVTLDDIFSS